MNKNSASFGSLEIKCIRPRDSQLQCGTGLQACWNRRVCQWSPIWKMLPSPRHPLLASSAGPPIHQTDRSGKRSDVCNNKKSWWLVFQTFQPNSPAQNALQHFYTGANSKANWASGSFMNLRTVGRKFGVTFHWSDFKSISNIKVFHLEAASLA